ncbi:MAG: Matrixin [Subtercola sp.]|jgi:hypothetical protein|nr:Matrixin [Subtercola sp.]
MISISAKRRRRLAAGMAALAVCALTFLGAPGGVLSANAEACTKAQQSRTLPTDDPSVIETQFCLSGEWATTSYFSTAPDYLKVDETVEDPKAPKYGFNVSDFFDLKKVDPYAIIKVFKDVADGAVTLTDDQKLAEKLALAQVKSQSLLNRQSTGSSDGCRVRSLTYTSVELATGQGWLPPASTAPAGAPSQITYAFSADVSDATRVVVLNTIEQYANAVRYQDASFRYPEQIVPYDPASPTGPTITFYPTTSTTDADGAHVGASTGMTSSTVDPGTGVSRWVTGMISVFEADATPIIVGHEIGHVLGLGHVNDQSSTMYPYGVANEGVPWAPSIQMDHIQDQAFSPCMFLPPVTPVN